MEMSTKFLVALLAAMFLLGIGVYFANLSEPISTVRATRPVLVFTLIVAMLGFGGMLMAKYAGYVLDSIGSYVPLFAVAGSAYFLALLCVHLLSPKLARAQEV